MDLIYIKLIPVIYPSNLDVLMGNLSRDVCRVFFTLIVRSRFFLRITRNKKLLDPLQFRALVAIIVLYNYII